MKIMVYLYKLKDKGGPPIMKGIRTMLLGVAIMLAVVAFHLYIMVGFWTDFIAVLGLIIVLAGYFSKSE